MAKVKQRPLPKRPILSWSSFGSVEKPRMASIESVKNVAFTTSGRAAIYQALLQLELPPGSTVLAPSYHCPTMIAPIFLANLNVAYFAINDRGLPNLSSINEDTIKLSKAMLVSHYFGFANSLQEVRSWCDTKNIALIEDCAHCYFGNAGERSVGAWGDYSTASLSKFFPVLEGGLLASERRNISNLQLIPASLKNEIKGCLDIIEISSRHNGIAGFNIIINSISKIKIFLKNIYLIKNSLDTESNLVEYCDMKRINKKPLWSTHFIKEKINKNKIIRTRQGNYFLYNRYFSSIKGARPLFNINLSHISIISPYVFPLWVDDAERIYRSLKEKNLPVFRWDKTWPDTPTIQNDYGQLWSCHVLQLLCHQDLDESEIDYIAKSIIQLLPE